MNLTKTERGFERIDHDTYIDGMGDKRLVAASSAIGDYPDAFDRPGSSFLWIGENHHLSREEVKEFAVRLNAWFKTGSLAI
jgi:hypothetical protein